MKTSTILFLVGSLVIIGGGALAFILVSKPAPESSQTATVAATTTALVETDTMTGSGSILGLMTGNKGQNMECAFVFTSSGARSEGTGFFIDGKARVDTLYSDDTSKQIASYMIMDTPDDTMYVWSLVDGEQTGMKMSISENKKMAAQLSENNQPAKQAVTPEQLSPESDVQYTCKSWSPDVTVFIPPTDVAFTDMAEMNKLMGDMMGGMKLPTQ